MTERQLSSAQLEQRAAAHRSHGAFSGTAIRGLQRKLYDRLLWRVRTATGRTTLRTRLALEKIAYCRARIQLAEEWLATREHPLFRNVDSGELWPIIEKVDEWTSIEAKYLAQLPRGAAPTLDLATELARRPRDRS